MAFYDRDSTATGIPSSIMVTPDMPSGRLIPKAGFVGTAAGTAGPAGLWAQRGSKMKLPGHLIVGSGTTTADNPLADVANWNTGGRKTSGAAAMAGDTMQINWMYIAGAAAVAFLLFRRK